MLLAGPAPPPPARAASPSTGALQQQIAGGRRRVGSLAGAVSAVTRRVDRLGAGAASLATEIERLQINLDGQRTEVLTLRGELQSAQGRLLPLEQAVADDERVLAEQLVGSYEDGQPDLITAVLESHGFSDLLERLDFVQRIGNRNAQIVGRVRIARAALTAQAIRLGALSQRRGQLADQVLQERNRIATDRMTLVSEQIAALRVRNVKAGQLATARTQLSTLTGRLTRLQADQRAAAAAAARQPTPTAGAPAPASASSGSASGGSGGSSGSSGSFTFPLPKSAASPPATWSPDEGVDISAPGGTPEYAVCSGTVVLHGIGGFGPSAPVIHCDTPLDGYSFVYYGHAGPGNWVPIGTHLSQGAVISQVGYGIVGISTGPHLEIGFADSSGNPIGPSTATTMLSLLTAAYG